MANTNAAGTQYLDDKNSEGTILGQAATDLVGMHGAAVAQASAISAVTGTVSLTTTINAMLSVIRDKGMIASA